MNNCIVNRFNYAVKVFFVFALIIVVSQSYAQTYTLDVSKVETKNNYKILNVEPHENAPIMFGANSHCFIKDGKSWFPIMGEFHFVRYPNKYWEEEILKMKSAGISIIATYIFWNAHEYPKGTWNWKGDEDLKQFVELCQKHDMYVWLRIGPWSHGEQLHGGHPKWINRMLRKRTNSSRYLKQVDKLFQQIGEQTKGCYYKDGGAILGVQLENEYANGKEGHITNLRNLALKDGIAPVYFSVTGNSVFDDKDCNTYPLQGGYPYRGWEKGGGSATSDFLFGNDQWIMEEDFGKLYYDLNVYPKGTCEQGCGSQQTYENRFVVEPEVIEAHLQNQIGRGMNLIGYYMFQGGTQMPGLKEPGYPESYDFQAPLSEFGVVQPSYKYLKILHHFVNNFGSDLAKTSVVFPENQVVDPLNTTDLRYVGRFYENSGYVFLGNTQVRVTMPDKKVKLKVKLSDENIEFPRNEFLLKGQTTAILPINFKINKAVLKYATAQPMSKVNTEDGEYLFFMKFNDVDLEFAFDDSTVKKIVADSWNREDVYGKIYLSSSSNNSSPITITDVDGTKSTIVILSREQAENSWQVELQGKNYLIISKSDLIYTDNILDLRQLSSNNFSFDVFPKLASGLSFNNKKLEYSNYEIFYHYEVSVNKKHPNVEINRGSDSKETVTLPKELGSNISDVFLEISYLGGSATAKSNGAILTDNLFNGTNWFFGLKRYISDERISSIEFEVQKLGRRVSGLPEKLKEEVESFNPKIIEIKIVPQYRVVLSIDK